MLALLALIPLGLRAQRCNPTATYYTAKGDTLTSLEGAQSAPIRGIFVANPDTLHSDTRYEWKITKTEGGTTETVLHRFDEDLEYTFMESGTFSIQLYATFSLNGQTYIFPGEGEENPFKIEITTSVLEMPNAFSPNGDGTNDTYRALSTHQSIVEFHATIFNRWGQKLYSWDDVNGEWDGTYNGRRVKDGVYFVRVRAKGADGHQFDIRSDVNVLTGYTREESSN